MDAKRRAIRNHFVARVFKDYCPLYWISDDVKNAGLEISKTISSIAASFNSEKSEFQNYLNHALKNAILKGRQNAVVGDSENLKNIRKETVAENETVLNKEAVQSLSVTSDKINASILDTINRRWFKENERHKSFLSLYLNSIFHEFGDYSNLCHKYEFLSATCKEFSPSMQQQEMAAKYGIEKTNASKIIARFKAKMPYLQSTLKNNRT